MYKKIVLATQCHRFLQFSDQSRSGRICMLCNMQWADTEIDIWMDTRTRDKAQVPITRLFLVFMYLSYTQSSDKATVSADIMLDKTDDAPLIW